MYRGEGGFYGLLMQETGNRDQGAGNPSRFAPGAGRKQGSGNREQENIPKVKILHCVQND